MCANMASNSKKGLGISDISNLLDSNEVTEKHLTSDDSEFSDTDDSSDTDFGEQEDDALLPDFDDNSGVGDTAYVNDNNFLWEDIDNFVGQREIFSGMSGPQNSAKDLTNAVDIFEQFFDKYIVQKIVTETNRYAEQFKNSRGNIFSKRSRVNEWQPVTAEEIYVVLALFMLMGIVQKTSLRLYFSRNHLVATPVFGSVISLDRFESICRFLHFTDNTTKDTYEGQQKLFKIYPLIRHLNSKFQTLYLPQQNISVDESLTLWKGRLSFKQYIPMKSSQFGIKTFELCESHSGYLWSFIVYTGKDTILESPLISRDTPKGTAIVLKLTEPLLHKGYTLWMDNYYNSPPLAKFLKSCNTDCVGTIRINRKGMPKKLQESKLQKGEAVAQHSGPICVLRWRDKKDVTMISTYHGAEFQSVVKRGKEKQKPLCVIHYNQHMGGVDKKDQLLQTYLVERKRMNKWYMKLFRRLLNATVLNSLVIYRQNGGRNVDHLTFRIELVEGLLAKYSVQRKVPGHHDGYSNIKRLTERHFPRRIPPTENKCKPTRRCVVCSKHKKRRETVYYCQDCDVALCVDGCFEVYHTRKCY